MGVLLAQPWVAVVMPVALAAVIALGARRVPAAGPMLAALGPLTVLTLGATALLSPGDGEVVAPWVSAPASAGVAPWFTVADANISLGWSIDALSAVMLLVVGFVALCVVIFSAGYMAGDQGWARYFALLSLFTGAMTMLVIGDSFLTLFIGWELVGACSYLLIGFWFDKPSAASAATKAFLTTRLGDVALLLGIAILWSATGTLAYSGIAEQAGAIPTGLLTAAVALVAVGAIGKSAQFPLHAWLPDAMEGPTPVSALIHAATMVAAGVYLIARVWPLFEAAPFAQLVVLTAGAVSAFAAALAALVQRDIKRVLAYSTISQLGFMFCALGVGAWFAAFFHLVTHAAFKALLFLGSGSVIHGSGTQDLHEMGGLRKAMPVTFATWLVGVAALMGLPLLSGFFSKDLVLEYVLHDAPALGVMLFGASAVTAVYTTRATRLAFFGSPRSSAHPHESPLTMLAALGALAVPAAALGFGQSAMSGALGYHAGPLDLVISSIAVSTAVLGIAIGWRLGAPPVDDTAMADDPAAVRLLRDGYGWDRLVDRGIVRPTVFASRTLWAFGDRLAIDGLVAGTAAAARWAGRAIAGRHIGDSQVYAAVMAMAVALMLAATVWLGRW